MNGAELHMNVGHELVSERRGQFSKLKEPLLGSFCLGCSSIWGPQKGPYLENYPCPAYVKHCHGFLGPWLREAAVSVMEVMSLLQEKNRFPYYSYTIVYPQNPILLFRPPPILIPKMLRKRSPGAKMPGARSVSRR